MSVEFYRESPGKFDSRTLKRKTLNRWTGRTGALGRHSLIGWANKHFNNLQFKNSLETKTNG